MEKSNTKYTIKKYVKQGVFIRLLPIILIICSMVIYSGFPKDQLCKVKLYYI